MPRIRNFSEKKEQEFLECANSCAEGIFNEPIAVNFDKLFQNLFSNGLCRGVIKLLAGVDDYNQLMWDSAHMSEEALKNIFEQARTYDKTQGQRFYCDSLLNDYNDVILNFANIIKPKDNFISEFEMTIKCEKIIDEFNNKYTAYTQNDNEESIPKKNSCINYDKIKYYIDNMGTILLFDGDDIYIANQIDYIKSLYKEDWQWYYANYNNAKDQVLSLTIDQNFQEVIAQIVESEVEQEKYNAINTKEIRSYLKKIKGMDPKKLMQSDEYNILVYKYPFVKTVFDKIGDANDIIKYVQKCDDEIEYLVNDYDTHIALLEYYKGVYSDNDRVISAINSLEIRYKNKFFGLVNDLVAEGMDVLAKEIKSSIVKDIPVVGVVSAFADTTMSFSGTQEVFDNCSKAEIAFELFKDSKDKYNELVSKILSGNYEMKDLGEAESQFYAMKTALINAYKYLYDATEDAYEKCKIRQLQKDIEKISMDDITRQCNNKK